MNSPAANYPAINTERRTVVATIDKTHSAVRHRLGGDLLVNIDPERGEFYVLTGPTPWGSGVWGGFPVAAILSEREPVATDSWPVNGCPSRRWTFEQLNTHCARLRNQW